MFLDIDKVDENKIAAIDEEGKQISYGDLISSAEHLSDKIPKRSIVFLLCKNVVGSLTAYYSMVENGIIPVTLNESMDKTLFKSLLEIYRPQYICARANPDLAARFTPVYEEYDFVYYKTGFEPYEVHKDLELLMTTSGTTGSPKLVRYKKGNLFANAKNVAISWEWNENERPVCDLQMNYTMGLNVINTHLYVGATLLLVKSNILEADFWKFIKEHKATNYTGVPFSFDLLWKLRFPRMDLPYLKTISEGGGKLSDRMFTELAEYAEKNNKRFIASFGTTETSARMAMLPAHMSGKKIGSIGKAINEGELMLLDSEGEIIDKTEAKGELAYRGPNVTMGYALSKEDLLLGDEFKGFYKTGDMAYRDEDGYYYIIGRKSRFLKLLGYRVSLDQCEQLIGEKFKTDCACVGSDEKMLIYVTGGQDISQVKHFISDKIGIYTSMFDVKNIDKLPRNSSGKIEYKKLC